MSFVETEINGQIITIRLNRPERLNALSTVIRDGMADAFNRFHEDKDLEVAILTGTGRGFCAGEDMKESIDKIHHSIADLPLINTLSSPYFLH